MTLSAITCQLWGYSNQGTGAPGLEASDVLLPGMEMVLGMHPDLFGGPSRISVLTLIYSKFILCSYSITWTFNFCLCFLKPVAFVLFCTSTAVKGTYSERGAAGPVHSAVPCSIQVSLSHSGLVSTRGHRSHVLLFLTHHFMAGFFSSLLHDLIIFQ